MRKMFKILTPLFCMTFILTACSTSAPASTQATPTPTLSSTAKATSSASSTSTAGTQTKFTYGQEGITGYWSIKILEVKEATNVKASDSTNSVTASQKFTIVKVQMTNISTTSLPYTQIDFVLGNTKSGGAYYMTATSISAANILNSNEIKNNNSEYFSLNTVVNPNILKKTYVVFEVPTDYDVSYGVLWKQNGGAATTGIYFLK